MGDVIISHTTSPNVSSYPWTHNTGFGVKYSNPSTLPGTNGKDVKAVSDGTDVFITSQYTPFISAYTYTPDTGWGTKYSAPSTPPTQFAWRCAVSGDDHDIAVGWAESPGAHATNFYVYPWANGVGFGAKYSDPASPPSGNYPGAPAFNDTDDIALGFYAAGDNKCVYVYPWTSGAGFGAKYSNYTDTYPSMRAEDLDFSPDGTDLAVANYDSPECFTGTCGQLVWSWQTGVGFGTKYLANNTGDNRHSAGYSIKFNSDGTQLGVAHTDGWILGMDSTASVYTYTHGAGLGFHEAIEEATYAVGYGIDIFEGDDGVYDIVVGCDGSNYLRSSTYIPGSGFSGVISAPATPPTGVGTGVLFIPISAAGPETSSCPMPAFRSIWPYIPVELWYRFSGRVD